MTEATIRPFIAVAHECEKCRGTDISFTHHANEHHSRYRCAAVDLLGTSRPPEHLCLRCRRCGHGWAMSTADITTVDDQGESDEIHETVEAFMPWQLQSVANQEEQTIPPPVETHGKSRLPITSWCCTCDKELTGDDGVGPLNHLAGKGGGGPDHYVIQVEGRLVIYRGGKTYTCPACDATIPPCDHFDWCPEREDVGPPWTPRPDSKPRNASQP